MLRTRSTKTNLALLPVFGANLASIAALHLHNTSSELLALAASLGA
jgi:hypothetical protein